jgi:hypothetical protein
MTASVHARHRERLVPRAVQLARGTWVWGAVVPYLPDVGFDRDQVEDPVTVAGYHALAEAVAAGASDASAVQVRLMASGASAGEPGVVTSAIVGRAQTEDHANRLASLVRATLPAEVPLRPVPDAEGVRALLGAVAVADGPTSAVAEIRRRVEESDKLPSSALQRDRTAPAVLRWSSDPFGLRVAVAVLAHHPTPVTVVLHMAPKHPSEELLDHLDQVVRDIAADIDPADNPLRRQVAGDYLRRLRTLPRAALEVRVAIAAQGRIEPGVAETVGMALTAEEAFTVRRPVDERELLLAATLFESVHARWWGSTGDPLVDEVQRLADTSEAAGVVRLPVPMRGGSPGLPSVPLSTLPRAAPLGRVRDEPAVHVGRGNGGGSVELTLDELNRHLLVAGLPGFGKTVTVHTLLHRLWDEHRVPFLVLDPAKSDYQALADRLGDDVQYIRLTPDDVAFNPFAVPEGCSAQSHAGRILAAFDSAFGLSAQWVGGYVALGRGLFAAYEALADGEAPTLNSVYASVGDTLRRSGFSGPDAANIRAALMGRLEFLVRGPLGSALAAGPRGGVDWGRLLRRPAIIEMRGFSGPAERSLVFALLLAGLISYRESNPQPRRLAHVTVLEEAHRVLAEGSGSEGVRLFVEAIAELRGSGEGFVIVDQAPTLLHAGVLKLSGSVLSHRLVDPDERIVVGSAVLLDARQQQDLARLSTGQAVLFSAGRTTSVVVDVDRSDPQSDDTEDPDPTASDSVVRAAASATLTGAGSLHRPFCIGCRNICRFAAQARRLLAAGQPCPETSPRRIVDHYVEHAARPGLMRCVSAMHLASCHTGTMPQFLTALRAMDDRVAEVHAATNSAAGTDAAAASGTAAP